MPKPDFCVCSVIHITENVSATDEGGRNGESGRRMVFFQAPFFPMKEIKEKNKKEVHFISFLKCFLSLEINIVTRLNMNQTK